VILTIERFQISPDITVLEMTGRIIMGNTSRDVELKVTELLREKTKRIIFDLKGITMVDSTGVGILFVCQGRIKKEGGELRIAGATGLVGTEDDQRKQTRSFVFHRDRSSHRLLGKNHVSI
jgi:anti-anti-sigma factor